VSISKDSLSTKKRKKGSRRPYRLQKRAERLEETRRRIVEALVELHRTVGPARTSVSEVAKRAGVRRMTVYNHFPTEHDLMEACSSHWVARHAPPDPAGWSEADPDARTLRALLELYPYYRANRDMVGHFHRDAPLMPVLAGILATKWFPLLDAMVRRLAEGRDVPPAGRFHACLRVFLDFATWRTLTESGLTDADAARLAADQIAAAARADTGTAP